MDIDKIRTFCTLIENKTLVEAAKISKLSVSGVQRQITSLEQELGTKLFQKQQRLLKPTAEGDRFYQHSLRILEEYDRALQEVNHKQEGLIGDFTIGATSASVASWLIEDISDFVRENKEVRFILIGDDRPLEFLKNECDVFIKPREKVSSKFEQKYLKTFSFNIYASKGYCKFYGIPKSLEDLKQHRIIVYGKPSSSFFWDVNWHLKHLPRNYRNLLFINSGLGILKAIENSLGIGVISTYGNILSKSQLVQLFPDLQPYTVDICMIYPSASLKKAHIEKFYKYCIRKYEVGSNP